MELEEFLASGERSRTVGRRLFSAFFLLLAVIASNLAIFIALQLQAVESFTAHEKLDVLAERVQEAESARNTYIQTYDDASFQAAMSRMEDFISALADAKTTLAANEHAIGYLDQIETDFQDYQQAFRTFSQVNSDLEVRRYDWREFLYESLTELQMLEIHLTRDEAFEAAPEAAPPADAVSDAGPTDGDSAADAARSAATTTAGGEVDADNSHATDDSVDLPDYDDLPDSDVRTDFDGPGGPDGEMDPRFEALRRINELQTIMIHTSSDSSSAGIVSGEGTKEEVEKLLDGLKALSLLLGTVDTLEGEVDTAEIADGADKKWYAYAILAFRSRAIQNDQDMTSARIRSLVLTAKDGIQQEIEDRRKLTFVAFILEWLAVAAVISAWIWRQVRSITMRLRQLKANAVLLARGEPPATMPVTPRDDLDQLFHHMHDMADSLASAQNALRSKNLELESANQNLERMVQVRTRDLEEAKNQLVMMNRALESDNETLEALASTDELTGILSRRALMARLEELRELALRHHHPFSVLIFDLDLFKQINDTWGHNTGDTVLRQTARGVSSCLRSSDWFGRYGGDEFLILMPDTRMKDVAPLMQRILRMLASTRMGEPRLIATISGGVAEFDGDTVESLLSRADDCLYLSKKNGRNRITLSDGLFFIGGEHLLPGAHAEEREAQA